MSLHPLIPWLMAALLGSVAGMTYAANLGDKVISLVAALTFAALAIAASLRINAPLWRPDPARPDAILVYATQRNSRLMAIVYGWGATALFAVYTLSELWWFHSWQYGLAMALIAAGLIGYVQRLCDDAHPLRRPAALNLSAWLAVGQSVAAIAGLVFLVRSGKPWGTNTDWAANHVFIAGGLAIAALSLIAPATHWRLRRQGRIAAETQHP
ncbi:MAG: hypothetical protein NW217_05220 [Hyphomicrobiaceae bacterium]|nr:hypothetical protein [Hyphomicrobiaceae bacterium]